MLQLASATKKHFLYTASERSPVLPPPPFNSTTILGTYS
jgi:hypothetical protein